jgi:hypothetical protein
VVVTRVRRIAHHLFVKAWPIWLALAGVAGAVGLAALLDVTPDERAA